MGLSVSGAGISTALDLIQPYSKNKQIAVCASDSESLGVDLSAILPGTTPTSYSANDQIATAPDITGALPVALSQVNQSARIPLIWDAAVDLMPPQFAPPLPNVVVERRHFEGANCAFVDGHVKWIKERPELSGSGAGGPYRFWNADPGAE